MGMTGGTKPCILLLGSPAAGKTTARLMVVEWLAARGEQVTPLGIEEAHRQLTPPGGEDGTYYYDDAGALILLDRERQVAEALELLADQCRHYLQTTGFVAELAHPDLAHALERVGMPVLTSAFCIYLSAPLPLRLARNRARGAARIPDEVVVGQPDSLPLAVSMLLRAVGVRVVELDTVGEVENLRQRISTVMARHFDGGITNDDQVREQVRPHIDSRVG